MQSKFEAWIPKLGREVDHRGCDEAGVEVCPLFDADEVGSFKLDSEAWMLCSCIEAGVEV